MGWRSIVSRAPVLINLPIMDVLSRVLLLFALDGVKDVETNERIRNPGVRFERGWLRGRRGWVLSYCFFTPMLVVVILTVLEVLNWVYTITKELGITSPDFVLSGRSRYSAIILGTITISWVLFSVPDMLKIHTISDFFSPSTLCKTSRALILGGCL